MPDRGEQPVLGDIVVEDGVDLGTSRFRESLDGGEGLDGKSMGLLEACHGQLIGAFAWVAASPPMERRSRRARTPPGHL